MLVGLCLGARLVFLAAVSHRRPARPCFQTMPTKTELLDHLRPWGQEHLLAFWDELAPAEQAHLAMQILRVDGALLTQLRQEQQRDAAAGDENSLNRLAARAESPPAILLDGTGAPFSPAQARACGEQALRDGQLGMILVAGGLGTRLNFDHPKGMFPLGPVSEQPLFQILIERLLAVSRRYGVSIPLYLMTSPATDAETRQFLDENNNFGLPADDLHIFPQETMWAIDDSWRRILLESRGSLFLGPDGHGGMLAALHGSGGLADIQRRGLRHLFYGQVDNPLLQVCDPQLVGSHILAESEMTTQVIRKRDPLERVGNVVSVDGRVHVIEYSDLAPELARQTTAAGGLKLWAGSMAVHLFAADFLRRVSADRGALPFHRAHKKVPYVDEQGNQVTPDQPNAIRFEKFIFDLLPAAQNALVLEADPAEAFAPVKNAPGEKSDTPATARAAMAARHRRWLLAAGVNVPPDVPVEISPLFALDADELKQKLPPGLRIDKPTYMGPR